MEHWANAFFPDRRYNLHTSNSSESQNNTFVDVRGLPIIVMIEGTRKKIVNYFYKKMIAANKLTSMLTFYGEKILNAARKQGIHILVYPSSIDHF